MCVYEHMVHSERMSAGIQENDSQQYGTLNEAEEKPLPIGSIIPTSRYTLYSPERSWSWDTIKSEVIPDSPKEFFSDDSESSQQTSSYCSERDANAENTPSMDGSFKFMDSPASEEISSRKKKKCKDMPAVNKPAQVVERRNARERRRVQAVNGAFQKLRKVVPMEENKSKRMSKVKTLQLAIEYINSLQNQLITKQPTHAHAHSTTHTTMLLRVQTRRSTLLELGEEHELPEANEADAFVDLYTDYQPQPSVKLELNEFPFRIPTSYYINDNEN